MSMRFRFVVEVEVERTQGKFATREELAEQIKESIEGADPSSLEGENGGEYEVSSFEVSEEEAPKPVRRAKAVSIPVPVITVPKPRDPFAGFPGVTPPMQMRPAITAVAINPAGCSPVTQHRIGLSMDRMILGETTEPVDPNTIAYPVARKIYLSMEQMIQIQQEQERICATPKCDAAVPGYATRCGDHEEA